VDGKLSHRNGCGVLDGPRCTSVPLQACPRNNFSCIGNYHSSDGCWTSLATANHHKINKIAFVWGWQPTCTLEGFGFASHAAKVRSVRI